MIRLRWTAILLFTISISQGFSANMSKSKEYQEQFKQAMICVQNEEYNKALPILNAMNETNSNANLDFHIGLCNYYLQFDKSSALASFDKAAKNIATKYSNTPEKEQAPNEVVYFQALCYQHLAQNDKAIAKYEEYLKNSKTYNSDRLIIADAKKKLKIAQETPALFTNAEQQQIIANRETTKKPGKDFKPKLQKAMELIQDDKIEALILLKEMLKECPNEPNTNYMMGICLLNIKPYNGLATEYFKVADKNSSNFKELGVGLDCPLLVKYYSGIANQTKGDHKQALADFEAFNAVYPENYLPFKPEFDKRMEYSRNMLKQQIPTDSAMLANYNLQLNIVDTAGLKVLFPIMGTPIENKTTSTTTTSSDLTYYYSVQVGAGNMIESYFSKVTELRTSKYPNGVKRFLTGKYATKGAALSRLNDIKGLGYSDAFITRMHGPK